MHASFPEDIFLGSSSFWQFHEPYTFGCSDGGEVGGSIALKNPMGIQFSRSLPVMEWKKHWLMSFTGTWICWIPAKYHGMQPRGPVLLLFSSCLSGQLQFTVSGEQLSRSCSSAGWHMVQGFFFRYLASKWSYWMKKSIGWNELLSVYWGYSAKLVTHCNSRLSWTYHRKHKLVPRCCRSVQALDQAI